MQFAGQQVLFAPSPSSLYFSAHHDGRSGWHLRVTASYQLPDASRCTAADNYGPLTTDELTDVILANLEVPPVP